MITIGNDCDSVICNQDRFSEIRLTLYCIFYAMQNQLFLFFIISENIFELFHKSHFSFCSSFHNLQATDTFTIFKQPLSSRFSIHQKESRFYVIFPAFCRLTRANLLYIYYYTLAFEPDFVLEQRSILNSECPS